MHEEGAKAENIPAEQTFDGRSLPKHPDNIQTVLNVLGSETILDYGSGKGRQYAPLEIEAANGKTYPDIKAFWGVKSITCYDPGYKPFSDLPSGTFDGVISTDVLEHCPKVDIPWIVREMFSFAREFVYLNVACYPAGKTLPNGENAHCTLEPPEWWLALFDLILRVRPETLCRITEFSEHESNGRELDEGERVAVEVLPVLGQSAAAVEPGDGAFDHPTPGLDDEALHPIGSLDDLGLEIGQDAGQGAVKDRPLIGAVGEQFPEKGKQTEQGRQQRETAVAILNVGGGDDAVQQQALRIDQNMPLLALDQLAGIEAVAVDASPPFSALFTL